MKNRKKLIVLGNGPSLKKFDFSILSNIDSIGMNAAYRYWERINIYPTHYICLDDQLIETHADAIYSLIVTGKIKTAFLIAKFLDYYPNIGERDNVFFLESFHTARQKRVIDNGIKYIKSIPFQESDSSKVTTGAYAIRYAAYLGYTDITILGVDLRYIEVLPEAKKSEGIKLVMKSTPKSNPNYFFDDYQQAGDKYNIPNPDVHSGNLHVAVFEVLANDVVQYNWGVTVSNSNRDSVLNDKGIFPFIHIESFIKKEALSAIVVPTTPKELPQILTNFKAWNQPRLIPFVGKIHEEMPALIFVFSCKEDQLLRNKVLKAYNEAINIRKIFSKCEVIFIGLDSKVDYYERDYTKVITGKGYKSGPNEQFFETINLLSEISGFIFYMETDCVPIRQGWLNCVMKLAQGDSESWVIGSIYRGIDKISDDFFMHINGNALYRVGNKEFIDFLNKYWRVSLYDVIEHKDKRMAYDCLISYLFTSSKPSTLNQSWIKYQEVSHRFRNSSFIQNISGSADNSLNVMDKVEELITNHEDTFLVHGRPFIQLLTDKLSSNDELSHSFSWGNYFAKHRQEKNIAKPLYSSLKDRQNSLDSKDTYFPKLLMIDGTAVGHSSATGQLKKVFLGNWSKSSFLQIWYGEGFHLFQLNQSIKSSRAISYDLDVLTKKCKEFKADVIYFRATESLELFDVVEKIINIIDKPLVIHIMDDWQERLRLENIKKYNQLDARLRSLIKYASGHLSISQKMSDIYNKRYGYTWMPLANGVDITEFKYKKTKIERSNKKPFVIRYMGALADDMTFTSVSDVAQVISSMHFKYSVCLEIYTMAWCKPKAKKELGVLSGVSIHDLVDMKEYNKYLCEADSLLLAYNFDSKSLRYTSLSLANKVPECLASAPLLAYGPTSIATIDFLRKINCVQMVTQRDVSLLKESIKQLVLEPEYCQNIVKKSRQFTLENLSKQKVCENFYNIILSMKDTKMSKNLLVGPFNREDSVHYDETDCIAQLYSGVLKGSVMIDVGAHHGWALLPFLKKDWSIYAFEPDNKNRTKLFDQLSKHKNKERVNVDIRCVSNISQKNLSFYGSEQSTGISGLSAFHETHVESQRVDTITLSEFFKNKPLSKVDFLKIDTEGHDLFVLKGFPWERTKPVVIECEYEDSKTIPLGYTFHDLAEFLIKKGYTVYVSEWHPIIRYGIRHDWKQLAKYPCQLSNTKSWGNLLAFRDTISEKDLTITIQKLLTVNNSETKKPPLTKINSHSGGEGIRYSRVIQDSHFTQLSDAQWQYQHSSAEQKLWVVIFDVPSTKGRSYIANIKLKSNKEITASVSLGRQGTSEYEGKAKSVQLVPNKEQNIRISNTFMKSHPMLKIQVDILKCEDNVANMEISSFFIIESMSSIEKYENGKNLKLSEVNTLFQEKYYSTAMSYYLIMGKQRQLSIYYDNALMAARKLGMDNISSVKELLNCKELFL